MRNICDMEQQNMSPAEVSRTSRTGETAHRALLIYLSCFLLTDTDKNGSQTTPKLLQFLKEKGPPFFPYLTLAVCHHLAGDVSKLRNSPSSHLSPTPESKWATPHPANRSDVPGGRQSPLFHSILSLPVINSYLVFKLLHALMICYNWIMDENNFMALWLISSTVCCVFLVIRPYFFHGAYLCCRASVSRRKPQGEGVSLASSLHWERCTTTFLTVEMIW